MSGGSGLSQLGIGCGAGHLMSDLKFYVKMIGGGLGCFVLGGLLLSMPGVEWWRAIAAFPLGLVLIALGVMYWRREQSNDHE